MDDYIKCFSLLNRGAELCRSREIPMPSNVIQELKKIYKECKYLLESNVHGDIPLTHASRIGLNDLIWGFIQYGKQTNTNPHTEETWELQKFLGYQNSSGQTALDVAIENILYDTVEAFGLEDVSWQELITDRNHDGETLVSLLRNQGYDEIIFKAMKAAGIGKVDSSSTSISISVDEDNHQESIDHTEHMMHLNTHTSSSQYKQSTTLNKLDDVQLESAPNGDTIIHFLSEDGKANDLKAILDIYPSLVYRRNHQGETPLFVASREGHLHILELLINFVKEKADLKALVTRSMDNYTALHIAIENHHAPIVFWLVNGLPQLANSINVFNESPLYLAAQRGYHHILRLILDESKEKSFEGPNGKTALHAAVMSQESVESYTASKSGLECVKSLLEKKIDLLYIHDKNGWTPFHYAVYHDIKKATVEALLEADPNIGYQNMAVDGINTPAIHIAATQGLWGAIQVLLVKCPRSLDITDSKGRNIFHVAIENRRIDIIKELFGHECFRNLANQRDSNGNTPLHLFMASDIEIDEMRMDRGVNIYALNNKKLTTLDVASSEKRHMLIKAMGTGVWNPQTSSKSREVSHELKSSDSDNEREIGGRVSKFGDSTIVVTALIATASFAAAFAVPGGFDGNEGSKQGMPILLRKAAYKAFVVSNALAFSCSCCVLFGYMRLQIYLLQYFAEKDKINKDGIVNRTAQRRLQRKRDKIEDNMSSITVFQYMLTIVAMVAMAFAFITGTYVILAPSLAFAISLGATCICIIVSLSFLPTKYFLYFSYIFTDVLDYLGFDE